MTAHHHTGTSTSSPGAGCSGHGPSAEALAQTPAAEMAECPVMVGTRVVKADAEAAGLVRDHNGQRYWLCCASCGPRFDTDPDRYAHAA
ncbi:hypothetical protein [Isoptericola croceus]|uniref:hypothetical protein n=1 Tax=Isoptericola croceus TaxID=3031406 RepID=UPI0023FA3BED|nr:hypothetical protein [Isoptericola croceus]